MLARLNLLSRSLLANWSSPNGLDPGGGSGRTSSARPRSHSLRKAHRKLGTGHRSSAQDGQYEFLLGVMCGALQSALQEQNERHDSPASSI